jgi:histone deacetylase complex regulatory component SIN3
VNEAPKGLGHEVLKLTTSCFQHRHVLQPEFYNQLLYMIKGFSTRSLTAGDLYDQVKQLLRNDVDLVEDFHQFLPESLYAPSIKSIGGIQVRDWLYQQNQKK